MTKRIYILLATYNGEKYLREQLDSLFRQTYQNWILWIHDDNSEDNTVNIIKEYKKKYPDKIIFLDDNVSTGGAKENFAYLLNSIDDNFDYLMFCDQDDVWLEDKIEVTLNKMLELEKENPDKPILVHTDLKVVDDKLNIISDSMFKYQKVNLNNQYDLKKLVVENVVTGCTMMLNKKLVNIVKEIPKEAVMHDWWIAIMTLKMEGIIYFLNKSTVLYRQHSLNIVGARKIGFLYYFKKLLKVKSVLASYIYIIRQYRKAGIDMSLLNFILIKFTLVVNKLLNFNNNVYFT